MKLTTGFSDEEFQQVIGAIRVIRRSEPAARSPPTVSSRDTQPVRSIL